MTDWTKQPSFRGTLEQSDDKGRMVCSFGRSGSNMLIHTVRLNTDIHLGLTHGRWGTWTEDRTIVYIVRNPLYVLPSYYRLLKSGMMYFDKYLPYIWDMNFQQFLRGEWYKAMEGVSWKEELGRIMGEVLKDPAACWAEHVRGHREAGTFAVRFEDLTEKYEETVRKVCDFLEHPIEEVKHPERPSGPNPSDGDPPDPRTYFNEEDIQLLYEGAAKEMKEWSYL
jgi:hypothetical protein